MSTAVLDKLDSMAPGASPKLSDLFLKAAGQHLNEDVSSELKSMVTPQGKVAVRAAVKKVVPVVSADALVGDETYIRPNGEKYHARKWGEHDDVQVLRKAHQEMQFVLLYVHLSKLPRRVAHCSLMRLVSLIQRFSPVSIHLWMELMS